MEQRLFEKLMGESDTLLGKYLVKHTEGGVKTILQTYDYNKQNLMDLFEKSDAYNGNLQIVRKIEIERGVDQLAVFEFRNYIRRKYSLTFSDPFMMLTKRTGKTINKTEDSEQYVDELGIKYGQKRSRAVLKVAKERWYTNDPNWERLYAKYSDAINPIKKTYTAILSINPIDYWTMSFGNSWSSCHTIDKNNIRKKPGDRYSGCYSAGTESYMLDETSMVFYLLDDKYDGDAPELEDKIMRCMFHYEGGILVRGRLYPQSNDDGASKVYQTITKFVINEINKITGYDGEWDHECGYDICENVVESYGNHYRDYEEFDMCAVYWRKDKYNKLTYDIIAIGHDAICPYCGREHGKEDSIVCLDCQ